MSLLREIQTELALSNVDVTVVLRKCKTLAARLKSAELAKWVDWELGGYPKDEQIPEYRQLLIAYYATFVNAAWRVDRAAVPLQVVPETYRDAFQYVKFRDGIAKAASFARASGTLAIDRPELIYALQGEIYPDMECIRVWGETSPSEFQQLLSAVTSRLLDFSLKLEEENPSAGEAAPNSEPVPREKLVTLVHNTFYGDVGAIAQNSEGFNQTVNLGVSPQEFLRFVTQFTNHLNELNLDERQKRRAEAQLAALRAESSSEPDAAIVKQAGRSLRSITEGAIGSLIATAVQPSVWLWIHETLKALSK
jgi:hypothetical protein